jgi:hypothetical protein
MGGSREEKLDDGKIINKIKGMRRFWSRGAKEDNF